MVKKFILLAFLGVLFCSTLTPASAQVVPNIRGLRAFTAEANFMSLPGFLRWQYFMENQVWISRSEAVSLARAQTRGS